MRYVFENIGLKRAWADNLIVYGTGYTDAWTAAGRKAGVVEAMITNRRTSGLTAALDMHV